MTTYIFNESGSIPGVPGTFAGVQVNIDASGAIDVQPLAQHPAFEAAPEAEAPPVVAEAPLQPTEVAPTIVQEQVPPGLVLNIN